MMENVNTFQKDGKDENNGKAKNILKGWKR